MLQISLNKGPGQVFFAMFSMCVFQLMALWMVTPKHLAESTISNYVITCGRWSTFVCYTSKLAFTVMELSDSRLSGFFSCFPKVVSSQLHCRSFCIIHSHMQIDKLSMIVRILVVH